MNDACGLKIFTYWPFNRSFHNVVRKKIPKKLFHDTRACSGYTVSTQDRHVFPCGDLEKVSWVITKAQNEVRDQTVTYKMEKTGDGLREVTPGDTILTNVGLCFE